MNGSWRSLEKAQMSRDHDWGLILIFEFRQLLRRRLSSLPFSGVHSFRGTSLNQRRTEAGWCPRPSCIDERRIRRRVWSSDARCPYPPTWLSQCQGMPPPNMGLAWFLTHFLFGIFVDLSCLQFIKLLPILYLSFGCPHLVNSRDRSLHSPLYTPLR